MAHLGKAYKVQFRRDLSRESLNRNGYPEAYRWSQSNVNGAVALDYFSQVVPLINLATNAQPPMQWQSAVRTAAGINYNARLIIDDPFNMPNSTGLFVVRDLTHSVDLFSFPLIKNTYAGQPSGFFGSASSGYMDSALWHVVAGSFFWNTAALTWAQYHP